MKQWWFGLALLAATAAQGRCGDDVQSSTPCGKCCAAQASTAPCCETKGADAKCCTSTSTAAKTCCGEACEAKCCTAKACVPCCDGELYTELVAILKETNSPDTFMAAVAGLMATEGHGKRAIPVVIRNAERLGVLKGIAKEEELSPVQELVQEYFDRCMGPRDRDVAYVEVAPAPAPVRFNARVVPAVPEYSAAPPVRPAPPVQDRTWAVPFPLFAQPQVIPFPPRAVDDGAPKCPECPATRGKAKAKDCDD